MTDNPDYELERYKAQLLNETERYKAELHANLESYRVEHAGQPVLIKATSDYALAAIRGLLFINGGTAIALLAFLADIWATNTTMARELAANLGYAMGFLVGGAGLSTLTAMLAYLAQRAINELDAPEGRTFHWVANVLTLAAIVTAFLSFALFAAGSFRALDAFTAGPAG